MAAGVVVVVVVVVGDVVADVASLEVEDAELAALEVPVVVVVVGLDVVDVVDAVTTVEEWCGEAPATTTPTPVAATVAATPMATVARRIRTSASFLERMASERPGFRVALVPGMGLVGRRLGLGGRGRGRVTGRPGRSA